MSRIIFVPQFPTPMRYQEWWFWKLADEFEKAGFYVTTLGEDYALQLSHDIEDYSMFSPIRDAIDLETMQINEYMNLDLRDDDILFLSDLSFPGFFGNVLFHKKPKKCFAFCHATSLNKLDYFEKYKACKFPVEEGYAYMMDKVFVGSKYHQIKLGWPNTLVTRLPYPPNPPCKTFKSEKKYDIVSASRPNPQKVDIKLESRIEEGFRTTIVRKFFNAWEDYYKHLSESKILLITSFEDTFGYQIVDAVLNGCIPLAPTRCAYPEILPRIYLYKDEQELIHRIDYILNSGDDVPVPKLLCDEQMRNFYKTIVQTIKGERDLPF
jgi:hypothetical protein